MPPHSSNNAHRPESGSLARIVNLPGARDTIPASPSLALAASPDALPPTPTAEERARILRICLRATGDRDAAEDLAQETLLEAWRHWEKLRQPGDPQARVRWLSAIAANVCRRWARATGRDLAHTSRLAAYGEDTEPNDAADLLADDGNALDTALEHAERAQLLDRALGLLPPETREALIARYLLEQPLSEIATRAGLSEATLSVRLHRGKQALRAHLATTLREDALTFGLLPVTDEGWQETRIWCPLCGGARLRGQLGGSPTRLQLRCPHCDPTERRFVEHVSLWGTLDGVRSLLVARNRVMTWADSYYRDGASARAVKCRCGRAAPLLALQPGESGLSRPGEHGLRAICSCDADNYTDISGMALSAAEGRRFWRAHPRIHLLPYREVETGGREALVVGYEAVGGGERLDTLFARDTYELLSIHQTRGT